MVAITEHNDFETLCVFRYDIHAHDQTDDVSGRVSRARGNL